MENLSKADAILRKLKWTKKRLSASWLDGSILDVSAKVGKPRAVELISAFGVASLPRIGWVTSLYKEGGGYSQTTEIALFNHGGRYEVRLFGDWKKLLPWLAE